MFKNILWVFLEKGALTIIQFVALLILSRILGPEDYGIYGVMMIFIAVSNILVDSGLSGALVQKKEIQSVDINTLFIANTAISIFLYVLLFLSAPLIEHFYDIPNLSSYIRVLGLSILIFALSQVQNALIIRNLQFRKSTVINVVASTVSLIAAILVAKKGFGVWALIYQNLINSIVVTLLMWLTTKTKIGINVSKESFSFLWKFGSYVLGENLLDTIVNNITTSIIPKIDSIGKSGLYFQASKISSIPNNIIGLSVDKFSFPVLSKEKERTVFLEKARLINKNLILIIIPLFSLLAYCSYPIIQLVLGEKWLDVAPYFSVLIWSGIGMLIQVFFRSMIKANGITKYLLHAEIIKSVVYLAGIMISASISVWAIIYCVVIMSVFGALLWAVYVKKVLGFRYRDQLSDMKKPIISLSIMILTIWFLNVPEQSYLRLAIVVLAYLEYLVINYLLKNQEILVLLNRAKVYFFEK